MTQELKIIKKEEKYPELVEGQTLWFIYIAETKYNSYYVGISPDPKRRLSAHNSGKGSQMAKQYGPFKLVYISKEGFNKSGARKREIQVKKWSRIKKLKLISGEWN